MRHANFIAQSCTHSCVRFASMCGNVFSWYGECGVRAEDDWLSRSSCGIGSRHEHSSSRGKWNQARSHFGTRVRRAWDRVCFHHRSGEGYSIRWSGPGFRKADHHSFGESRFLRKESTACKSHRREEHESFLSWQCKRYTNRTGLLADHKRSCREMRLPDRSARRRPRREPASLLLLV